MKADLSHLGVIIQARMSSRRLPGKVLKTLCGKTVLDHLADRIASAVSRDRIVIATSAGAEDDVIAEAGKRMGIKVFRGSLEDVLDRFYHAAKQFAIDPVVRITADNPLLEPLYLKDLIRCFVEADADYVSAKNPDFFPRGTTGEMISFSALETAWREGSTPADREHVTWFVRTRPERFKALEMEARREWQPLHAIRLALDEPEDFLLLERLFGRFSAENPLFGLAEISTLYGREPHFFNINRHVQPTTLSNSNGGN